MDDKQKLPEPGVLELKDRWKTAAGQQVRRKLLIALRVGSEDWPELLLDLPPVSNPLSPNDLDDLRGIELPGEMLDRISLACCDLSYSNLQHCSLRKASLQRSRLNWADLQLCNLVGADLLNLEALHANFSDCKFNGAMMMSSNFRHSGFARTELKSCVLNGSDFTGSDLKPTAFERNEVHSVTFPETFDLARHLNKSISKRDLKPFSP
ncbi:pentapeptide repeat-containing protein [Pseudomonas sp. MM213]|uniref:pentapeptide repeat-containing protein n=1 Tax=Pseudomonas sp. MM213 TaxID=2866807 RepID=UPI001CF5F182|nr:pentapeptide repeat-containing protein [Pseudomonas sp. MM213]UCP11544.1 pentapeptide repeat-containing protein [Pseudomonas sp. MM213]